MTDRINAITVILEKDVRDDIEPLLTSIRQMRGVLRVEPHVREGIDAYVTEMRVKNEMRERLLELYEGLR